MPQVLTLTRFGDPVLREEAQILSIEQIKSHDIQSLIVNMSYTLDKENYGVGIAAPQVGKSVALSVIGIKPTPNRPNLKVFKTVLINPEILETYGDPLPMWEACVSCGSAKDLLYARVPRFEKVKLRWTDDHAVAREEVLDGFIAHVAQHEVDHLNGVLFVDKVKDSSTYMMADEYQKRIAKTR